jgi:hypothetical protein
MLPGASLMQIVETEGGIKVTCPGCKRVEVFRTDRTGVESRGFTHRVNCPVYRQIARALAVLKGGPDGPATTH